MLKCSQDSPKMPKNVPEIIPKCSQVDPQLVPNEPKLVPSWPKMPPRRFQGAPRVPSLFNLIPFCSILAPCCPIMVPFSESWYHAVHQIFLRCATVAVTYVQQLPFKRASRSIYDRFILEAFWVQVGSFWLHLAPSCSHLAHLATTLPSRCSQDAPRWPNLAQNDPT